MTREVCGANLIRDGLREWTVIVAVAELGDPRSISTYVAKATHVPWPDGRSPDGSDGHLIITATTRDDDQALVSGFVMESIAAATGRSTHGPDEQAIAS